MGKRTRRRSPTASPVEELPIDTIVIDERRREDLGDVQELAESIRQYGLLEPIVVDAHHHLVAGERRLRAVAHLGWTSIPAQRYGALTRAERLELEFEENERRKALTEYERSKRIAELADWQRTRLATGMDETRPTVGEVSTEANQESRSAARRGPKPRPDSQRAIAQELGLSQQEVSERTRHVQAATRYPELKEFLPKVANEMAARLDALPAEERDQKLAAVGTRDETTLAELSPHLRRQATPGRTPAGQQESQDRPRAPDDVREALQAGLQALDPLLRLVPEQLAQALTVHDQQVVLPVLERVADWIGKLYAALAAGAGSGGREGAPAVSSVLLVDDDQGGDEQAEETRQLRLASRGTDGEASADESVAAVETSAPAVAGLDATLYRHPCRTCDRETICQSPSMCGEGRHLCICPACIDQNERDLAGVG
jgi:ParB-like chromosome segregation protein Spo0J